MVESLLVAFEFYFINCNIFSEGHLTTLSIEGNSTNLYKSLPIDLINNNPRKKRTYSLSVNHEVYFDSSEKNSL